MKRPRIFTRNTRRNVRRKERNTGLSFEALERRNLLATVAPGWAFELGQLPLYHNSDIAVSADNHIIVTGSFEGTVDFDPGPGVSELTATSGTDEFDGYVAKYTADKQLVWARPLGGVGFEEVKTATVDDSGNVYIGGQFDSAAADFGNISIGSHGGEDGFVAKLDGSGSFLWAHAIGGALDDILSTEINVSDDGNTILVNGGFRDTVDFDPGAGEFSVTSQGENDGYVATFNSNGEFQWVWTHGGTGRDGQAFADFGEDGNVYVTSKFQQTNDLGQGIVLTATTPDQWDTFVAKLDSSGVTQWARQFSSPEEMWGSRITADSDGNVFVASKFGDTADLGSGATPLFGSDDGGVNDYFVMRLDADNQVQWVQQFTSFGFEFHMADLQLDHLGNPIIAGSFSGTIYLDSGSGTDVYQSSADGLSRDGFALGLDAIDGSTAWSHHFSGIGTNKLNGIASDSLGRVFVKGSFYDEMQSPTGDVFKGNPPLETEFVARLDVNSDFEFGTVQYDSSDTPLALNDARRNSPGITTSQLTIEDDFKIFDLNVLVNIKHTFVSDLRLTLIAPDDTRIQLASFVGGDGDNFGGIVDGNFVPTRFDQSAETLITEGTAPFAASFRPVGDGTDDSGLSLLNGLSTQGTWQLEILDNVRKDSGTLEAWAIEVQQFLPTPNDPPVASDDAFTVDEDHVLSVAAPGLLANDSDPENDPLTTVLESGPAHGSLTLNSDGSFEYAPDSNFSGSDSFTYRANDGSSQSNIATVLLDVNAVNDAPVAITDSFSVEQDSTLNQGGPGVLKNDIDVDGDSLTAQLVSDASNGTLTLNQDGSFIYTPDSGFVGADSFTYHITDGQLDSAPVLVSIDVTEIGGDQNLMYVGEINIESRQRGRNSTDYRIRVDIRWDSDRDGVGESGDQGLAGAQVTLVFNGVTYTGVTDSNGVFRTGWIKNLSSGDYLAEVTGLVMSEFDWDHLLDLEDDDDNDQLPDDWFTI